MGLAPICIDKTWWVSTLPAIVKANNLVDGFLLFSIFMAVLLGGFLTWALSPGGLAWKNGRNRLGEVPVPGPRGFPFFGSLFSLTHGLAHRTLACMASKQAATNLMAFSLGSTPAVITSDPQIAREILTSPHFANRPIKATAKKLMFSRAIGFAPDGTYWRLLRRISSTHLFAPKRIAAHEKSRQLDCGSLLCAIAKEQSSNGIVVLRKHLQAAALNNIMVTVFGKRYDLCQGDDDEAKELQEIVADSSDFVSVLLSLDGDDKLNEEDIEAVLWEMIFRGTDTTALLTEWIVAELVLNPEIQSKLHQELVVAVGDKSVTDADVANLPYLQAVVKETLRLHPPGPLLSWARISTSDVQLSNGMVVPSDTTAMVNMWAITHDPNVWEDPLVFRPERFVKYLGGAEVDVRGGDLRLAPFGAGRRVCPGKNLGLVTVGLWVAKLVQHFKWVQDLANPVDLTELLKLSCEMKNPLRAMAIPRNSILRRSGDW
ncbi:hypothetical protein Golax_003733 [Gossypium laxum]|uniref:Cytochrome P450 n=1 Tax=Gossypium laxum TaxID=34288 RepID=A0A7J9AI31_9ROSI|nr:hypothetical protein [Gossypium laxum]